MNLGSCLSHKICERKKVRPIGIGIRVSELLRPIGIGNIFHIIKITLLKWVLISLVHKLFVSHPSGTNLT